MTAPGPAILGRGVVINDGDPVPAPWQDAAAVTVDEIVLAEPSLAVAALHEAWATRRPVVIRLAVDPVRFRQPVSEALEPWTVGARHEVWFDRLQFLVWANTYDARGGIDPVWWWARKAERAGAAPASDEPAGGVDGDIVVPGSGPAWVDGGPRGPLDHAALGGAALVHAESVELGRLTLVPPITAPVADLAPDQLAAVAHGAGPARIIAPAGSGKTRVLTERLRHLIVDRGIEPEIVLAVAYNKKAQEELEERCASFRPRVQTLNALGYALLRQARGRPPRLLEEREVRRIVEGLVPRGPRRVNTDPLAPYLEALSLIRLGLLDPEEVEDERDDVPGVAAAFEPYRRTLAEAGAIDFDEQIYSAIELLLADGPFRRRAQAACRHLLVDEFQDLTPAHVLLLRLLASPALDVFGVGDDDQVIYGHAGADPAFLVGFSSLFPGAASHPLEINYRCPVAVVETAKTLLSYNQLRVEKEIRPGPDAETDPDAFAVRLHTSDGGAVATVDVVESWLAEPGVEPTDIAVLTRVNSLLLAPHVSLAQAGVPIDSVLRADVLERTGIRAALAYIRIATRPEGFSAADVIEVYRRPSRGFPQWITKWFKGTLTTDKLRATGSRLDDDKVAIKLEDLAEDLDIVIDVASEGNTADVLAVVRDDIGLGGAMGLLDGIVAGGGGGSSHLDDLDALAQVAALHPDASTFESWLRDALRQGGLPGGVTLSTVHRVKGREWDRVALFGVNAGVVPHRLADDREEERRVLHVGITRARRRAVVLSDAARPSPFLEELAGRAPHRPAGAADRAAQAAGSREVTPRLKPSGGRGEKAGSAAAAMTPSDQAAEEALRAWRLDRSRRDKVAAFIVLSDRHLRGIAVARPTTLKQLRSMEGIGPTKLELYGDEILAVIESLGDR